MGDMHTDPMSLPGLSDCGANVGSFARMAAPALGPRGLLYAIEPIPAVRAAL